MKLILRMLSWQLWQHRPVLYWLNFLDPLLRSLGLKPRPGRLRRDRGEIKVKSTVNDDRLPVHSFSTMLEDLQTLVRITVRSKVSGANAFNKMTEAAPVQKKILQLLDI